jgi:hypothetical protein
MEVRSYKGYDIHAVPHQLADTGDWTINIQSSHQSGGRIRWRQFSAGNRFRTRQDAGAHCFNFGQQIIDGESKTLRWTVFDDERAWNGNQ